MRSFLTFRPATGTAGRFFFFLEPAPHLEMPPFFFRLLRRRPGLRQRIRCPYRQDGTYLGSWTSGWTQLVQNATFLFKASMPSRLGLHSFVLLFCPNSFLQPRYFRDE